MTKNFFIAILLLVSVNLYAVDKPSAEFANAVQEAHYQQLTAELRCVVCQNQSIADSNAELAQDMRDLIRKMILEGKTDEQITGFLVERYGDFVLYNPPVKPTTYVLWVGPLLLLLLGIVVLVYFIRRHATITATPLSLTEEERSKLKQVVGETNS